MMLKLRTWHRKRQHFKKLPEIIVFILSGDIRLEENVTYLKVGKPDNRSRLELISQLRATVYLHVGNSPSYLNPPHHGYS